MSDNFKKFKNKLMREHLLKAILFGTAGGLVASSISLITSGAVGASLHPMIHIGIGLAGFAATTLSYFFAKKPKDKNIARRLDKDLELHEKVSTMVEFQDQSSLLIDKQRSDAKEKLENKKNAKLPFRLAVFNIPALVISAALFTGSLFTPQIKNVIDQITENRPGPSDEDFDHAHENVDNSGAEDSVKDDIHDVINGVEEGIQNGKDPDQAIEDGKNEIDKIVDDANTSDEIGDALSKSEDPLLKELGEAIKAGDKDRVNAALDAIYESLAKLSGNTLANRLDEIANEIERALADSKIPEGDDLRDSLQKLADRFREIAAALRQGLEDGKDETEASDEAKEDIKDATDDAKKEVGDALDQEKENEKAGEQAKDDLENMKDPNKKDPNGEKEPGKDGEQDPTGDEEPKPGDENQDEQENNQNQDQNSNQGESNKNEDGDADGNGGSNNENEGNGNSDSNDPSNSDGDATGDGNSSGKGEDNGGSKPGGSGAGGGTGDQEKGPSDVIFTGDEYKDIGDVIDDAKNDAVNDAIDSGDPLDEDIEDYFDIIYGNGDSGTNP